VDFVQGAVIVNSNSNFEILVNVLAFVELYVYICKVTTQDQFSKFVTAYESNSN